MYHSSNASKLETWQACEGWQITPAGTMQWRPQKCAAQQEMMCVMSAKTLSPCLCSFTHSACWPFWVCVCERVSVLLHAWVNLPLTFSRQPSGTLLSPRQPSRSFRSCVSPSSMLVSRRCVFLNHSLEWILKFTVNSDSAEVIYLTMFLMQGQQNGHIIFQSKRITAQPVGLS